MIERVNPKDARASDIAWPRPTRGLSQASLGSVQGTLFASWAVSVGSSSMRRKQLSLTITTTTSQTLAR